MKLFTALVTLLLAFGQNHKLIQQHDCQPLSTLVPPVAGYLIGLHSKPHQKLFYRSSDVSIW